MDEPQPRIEARIEARPVVLIRDGLLDRLKATSGLTDEAFAKAIGVSRATLVRVRNGGEAPSIAFIAGIANAFSLGLGEVAIIKRTEQAA